MPIFTYQATDQRGRSFRGSMPANDESNLEERLREAGLWLIDANLERAGHDKNRRAEGQVSKVKLSGKRKRRTLIEFCTLMSFQIRVGVPLIQALQVAVQDCEDPKFRKVLGG